MENKDHRNMVKEMLDRDDIGLNNWEIEFLDNMFKWSKPYTETQANKIEQIYNKKMGD